MDIKLAANVQQIKLAPIFAISAKANELIALGKKIISLDMGEPDFDTPQHIKDAAIQAIQNGLTKYTPVDGIPSLKKAIIERMHIDNKLTYSPKQIIVSSGAKQSLFNLFMALLNPGDEMLVQAPYWPAYLDMAKLLGAVPVIINTDPKDFFKLTSQQLERAITLKTKLLILNSPSNPTGIAYSIDELRALSNVLLKHPNIIVASDDVYEHTIWDHTKFANIVMANPDMQDRSVIISSVSKAYAMTGWRIGYAAGPEKIITAMKIIQSQVTSNPASISQAAAEAALSGDQNCISEMTKSYKKRHELIIEGLKRIPHIKCHSPDGTFYTFPNVEAIIAKSETVHNDLELTAYLLNNGVSVIPGSIFGAPGYLRISCAIKQKNLEEALVLIEEAISKLK